MTKSRDIASAIPAPSTISSAELGYLDGVTSAIQTQMDAKTAKATLTTTGDIYYASSASTPARLGIGSSAQVLTVASGVPSWATPASGGGMTLLSTTTLTSTSTTISSISGSYVSLVLFISGVNVSSNCNFRCNVNATSQTIAQGGTDNATAYSDVASTVIQLRGTQDEMKSGNADSVFFLQFDNYASTTFNKTFTLISRFLHPAGGVRTLNAGGSILMPSTAISSLQFDLSGGATFSAGTVLIYGVK